MSHRIRLQDAFKRVTSDQDKVLPPEETVRRFRQKLKSLQLDILEDTVRIDSGRLGIPVYFSLCGPRAREVIGTKKQMGKGATPEQAEASAVMELAERFSFFSFARNPKNFVRKTYGEVQSRALPFELIARSVHDESADLPAARRIFEHLPLQWTWGYNLTRNCEVLIPFDWFFAINEFNGPSAGNCAEEALCQGICEIVERHTSAIVSRNRLRVPGIRPQSAEDPLVLEMLSKYEKVGVRLFISDFTLDMGIPTVAVLAYDPSTFPEFSEMVWTAGTTPSPQKALSRALTEVAQLAGDFETASNYVASGLPKFRRIEEADFVTNPETMVDLSSLPDISDINFKVEVERCVAALQRRQMEVLAINTTHRELAIPAFYTIVPGAHFRERAAGTSVGMFAAKLTAENNPPHVAVEALEEMDRLLPGKYYVQFYLGWCRLESGQADEALPHFERALDLDPTEQDIPSIYVYMAVALKEMGAYTKALDVLEGAGKYDSERTDIYNLEGFCHYRLGNHRQAIEAFRKAVQLNPASAIDYANIASNYRELGQTEKAIRYYEMALALDDSIEFARTNLQKLKGSDDRSSSAPRIDG